MPPFQVVENEGTISNSIICYYEMCPWCSGYVVRLGIYRGPLFKLWLRQTISIMNVNGKSLRCNRWLVSGMVDDHERRLYFTTIRDKKTYRFAYTHYYISFRY